ncbi:MAG: aryl-sulfate sulfotransferase [Bacteroidota bacterium]
MRKSFILLGFCLLSMGLFGQNTVGLISHDDSKAQPGYNLLYPAGQSNAFLLDNCGRIVHTWPDTSYLRPGNGIYLLENGNLVKAKRNDFVGNDSIWAPGGGETIEVRDWDNNRLHFIKIQDSLARLHHDIRVMPNGNILAIVWEYISGADAIQAGRNPATMSRNRVWPDKIIELTPELDSVVWEWRAWDHLIQDFDSTKDNYGVVGDHPELIDFNWDTNNGSPDWMHVNCVDYNPVLDQIIISVPQFHEIWVIDHSTTTEEATGHTGGNSGMGGDLLFRWGNPQTYRAGTEADQQLFYQHDIHWIDDGYVNPNNPYWGKLLLFNNRVNDTLSTVNVLTPSYDSTNYSYGMNMLEGTFLPDTFDATFTYPKPSRTWSTIVSSAQFLSNNNLLVTVGRVGFHFELTPDNEVVWEYITPMDGVRIADQGDTLGIADNITFRTRRYNLDFPAFAGKDLSPKGWFEGNPDSTFCGTIVLSNNPEEEIEYTLYPNPVSETLHLEWQAQADLEMFDMIGRKVFQMEVKNGRNDIDVSGLKTGVYMITIDGQFLEKVIVQ